MKGVQRRRINWLLPMVLMTIGLQAPESPARASRLGP